MYAIIETGGKQFMVYPGETIKVEKLDAKLGEELKFQALWAVSDAKEGEEPVSSRKGEVTAEVVAQGRAKKIIVFKKRPKKNYKKMQGHRQYITNIRIKDISVN